MQYAVYIAILDFCYKVNLMVTPFQESLQFGYIAGPCPLLNH